MSVLRYESNPAVSKEHTKKPVIEAGDIVLKAGTPCDLMIGVNATDWRGRDISRNIRIVGAEKLDVSKAGVTFIDYYVIDEGGAFAKKSIKVIIE